jgi:hypothetical protein
MKLKNNGKLKIEKEPLIKNRHEERSGDKESLKKDSKY